MVSIRTIAPMLFQAAGAFLEGAVNTILPSQIEVFQSPDGVHFRLPPPAGSSGDAHHDVCVTTDGKLRWQTTSDTTPTTNELAVGDLAQFVIGPFGDLAVLSVKTRQGTTHAVCVGYPRDWLGALATELDHLCRVLTGRASSPSPSAFEVMHALGEKIQVARGGLAAFKDDPNAGTCRQLGEALRALYEKVQTVSDGTSVDAFQEDPDQPPSSKVIYQVRDNGVALLVPPGGYGFFFLLGCGLCAFAAVPTLASLLTGFRATDGSYWPVVIVVILWAAALAVFLPAFHNARSQVELTVVGDELEMLQSSPLRTRRCSWNRADLADVRCGDNGWVSGGEDDSTMTPVVQLHILPKGEKKVGLLTGRDAAEVRWIAAVLRRALHLSHASDDALSQVRS